MGTAYLGSQRDPRSFQLMEIAYFGGKYDNRSLQTMEHHILAVKRTTGLLSSWESHTLAANTKKFYQPMRTMICNPYQIKDVLVKSLAIW